MALWLRDSARSGVLRQLRFDIESDDASPRSANDHIDRAERYLDTVLSLLSRDALLDEEDELEPSTFGLYVADSGKVWELSSDGWRMRGYADEKLSTETDTIAVDWLAIGKEAETLTPWLKSPHRMATVYRGTSHSAHYVHKPFVWRVYCVTCSREILSRPAVRYRTAENKAVHHNQSVHGIDYWSDR